MDIAFSFGYILLFLLEKSHFIKYLSQFKRNMDLKAWKFKQRTGGYRKKVRRVYQNMQDLKKKTVCENSVIEILNNT